MYMYIYLYINVIIRNYFINHVFSGAVSLRMNLKTPFNLNIIQIYAPATKFTFKKTDFFYNMAKTTNKEKCTLRIFRSKVQ